MDVDLEDLLRTSVDEANNYLIDTAYPLLMSLHVHDAFRDEEERKIKYQETYQLLRSLHNAVQNNKDSDFVKGIAFEGFKPVLHVFTSTIACSSETDTRMHGLALDILTTMADHSSAREMYSIVMEHLSVGPSQLLQMLFVDTPSNASLPIIDLTVVELIKLLRPTLQRLGGKRYNFMKSALPTILNITSSFVKIPSQSVLNDEEQAKLANLQKEQSENRYRMFVQPLADLALALSKPFATKTLKEIQSDVNLRREHQWILYMCFANLSKIFSNEILVNDLSQYVIQFMKAISMCSCPYLYIITYFNRYEEWNDKKDKMQVEDLEEQDLIDDDDEEEDGDEKRTIYFTQLTIAEELENFVQWDMHGVGLFSYLVMMGVERGQYSTNVLNPLYLFNANRIYLQTMLLSPIPSYARVAKDFSRQLLENIREKIKLAPENMQEEIERSMIGKKLITSRFDDVKSKFSSNTTHTTVYFEYIQSLVNFVASCPDDAERSDGFSILQLLIDKFDDDGRFEILRRTIAVCPFRSIAGLLLLRLKDEIRLEYDSVLKRINAKVLNEYQPLRPLPIEQANVQFQVPEILPPSVTMDKDTIRLLQLYAKESPLFLQKGKSIELLLELLEKNMWHADEPIADEDVDLIMYGLNLYYFLLLRDNQPNITGVMDSSFRDKMETKVLAPLQESMDTFLEELNVEQSQSGDDIDTDELDLSDIEEDDSMDEIEREAIRELRKEIEEKQKQKKKELFKHMPAQDRIQLRLRLLMLSDVIERINNL